MNEGEKTFSVLGDSGGHLPLLESGSPAPHRMWWCPPEPSQGDTWGTVGDTWCQKTGVLCRSLATAYTVALTGSPAYANGSGSSSILNRIPR